MSRQGGGILGIHDETFNGTYIDTLLTDDAPEPVDLPDLLFF
jgi:hypothetical protein